MALSSMQVALAQAQGKGTSKGKKVGKGGKSAKGLASANSSSSKDINKTDAAYQEACNLLQGLDDTQGIFTLTVAKWTAAIEKVTGRLTPEAMDSITSGSPEQKAKGLQLIESLRIVEEQLKASHKLVESLGAAEGEPLKPEFMRAALSHAVMSNVKVSPAVHDILAVRTITCYQQAGDWQAIQSYLLEALTGTSLKPASKMEILKHGVAAALEILVADFPRQSKEARPIASKGVSLLQTISDTWRSFCIFLCYLVKLYIIVYIYIMKYQYQYQYHIITLTK